MENNNVSLQTAMNEKDWSKLVQNLNITKRLSKESIFTKLAVLYTTLLGESVHPVQAVYFFYAQLAALGLFYPYALELGWRTCFLLILCHALRSIFMFKK